MTYNKSSITDLIQINNNPKVNSKLVNILLYIKNID